MKVTVKFDESAALKPSEVKVQQAESERLRERNRQWAQCNQAVAGMARQNLSVSFGELIALKGVKL